MQCSGTENCPARKYPDTPCWEIAEKLWTSNSVTSICEDCIVYVIKTNESILTEEEMDDILRYRTAVQVEICPVCEKKSEKD